MRAAVKIIHQMSDNIRAAALPGKTEILRR
jgi:hypothetical protein